MGKSHKRGICSKERTHSRWGRGLWRWAEQAVAETAEADAAGRPAPEVAGRLAPEQEAGRPAPAAWCAPEYWVHSEDAGQTLQKVYRTFSWRLHEGYVDYAAGAAAHCLVKRREGRLEPRHWALVDPDIRQTLVNYLYDHPTDGYTGRAPRFT